MFRYTHTNLLYTGPDRYVQLSPRILSNTVVRFVSEKSLYL